MKRKIWIVALLVLCLIATTVAVGCKKKQPTQGTVLLSGFESIDELLSMNWQNMFGAVDLADDETYVTEGEHAAKLSVRGDYSAGVAARPTMTVYTDSEWLDKQDFSDTTKMTVDVYNAQDSAVNLYFQFAVLNDQNTFQYSSATKIELQSGMNHVELPLDRGFLNQLIDIKNIMRLVFMFDNETEKNQPARVLYMDNFRAHTTTEPIPTDVKIRAEHEIESADRAEYISSWSIINYRFSPSELTHNTDPKYISQGTGSFKFSAPATGGGVTSPGIVLASPAIRDISSYYSISFDIYNDNDKDYAFTTLTFKTFGVAKAKAWTRFEFTIEQLKTFVDEGLLNMPGYDESIGAHYYDIHDFKNFTLLTNNDSKDKPITFYFDNFFANPVDIAKPTVTLDGEYSTEVNLNEEYTVPTDVTVEKGTLDGWKIYAPDGTQVGENNAASFTPTVKGDYKIVYSASNSNGTTEFTLVVYAGLPPTIKLDRPNVSVDAGPYAVPVPAVANGGVLSWKVYRMTDGVRTQIGGENEPSFNAEGGFYLVEYTAVNDEAERKAYHNVLVGGADGSNRLQKAYPELYSVEKVKANVGSVSITSNKNYTLGDDKAIRMSGSGTVSFEYAFGTDVGTAQSFGFAIYNPTDVELTFTFGMATNYSLKPHSFLRFDFPTEWYRTWRCINTETNILEKVNFSLSGDGVIEAYLTFFTLSPVQEGPAINISAYEDHMTELTEYTVPVATASGGVAVSHKIYKLNGDTWELFADESPATFTPDEEGSYKIVYSATNVFGTSEREIVILFGKIPEIELEFTDKRIDEGTYTITVPTVENADNVAWKVYQIFSNLLFGNSDRVQIGGDSPESFTAIGGYTYEIVYTSVNSVATVTAVQRLAVEGGLRLEEKMPAGFIAENLDLEAGTTASVVNEGRLTEKTIKATGKDRVNYTFKPNIYLSAGATSMPFWIMNDSDSAVSLTIAGANAWGVPFTLQPGIWYRVELPIDLYLKTWGIVDADNYLRHLNLTFTGTGELTIYVDLFTVHTSEAVAFKVPSDVVTETNIHEPYNVPVVTAKDGSDVTWKITDADGIPVSADLIEGNVFTPALGGRYNIEYTATNVYGTSVYTIVITAIAHTPELSEIETHVLVETGLAPNISYNIVPPTAEDGSEVTWKIYQCSNDLVWGNGDYSLLRDDSPTSIDVLAGVSYRIEYNATNEDGTTTVVQYLAVEGGFRVEEAEADTFIEENLAAVTEGSVALSDEGMTAKSITATGTNAAKFSFRPKAYLGAEQTSIAFWVYNASANDVKATLGKDIERTLKPHVWYRVLYPVQYYREWQAIDENNQLVDLGFIFTGTGEIKVYVDLFTVYIPEGSAVGFNVPQGIQTEGNLNEVYTVPEITAKDESEVTWKVLGPDGAQIGEDKASEFTPTQGGTYKIEYTATNGYGTSVYTLNVTVIAQTPELTGIKTHVHIDTGSSEVVPYAITPPTSNDGSPVTWKVYQLNKDTGEETLISEESPASINVIIAVSYRIEFSATNANGTTTVVQYLAAEGGYYLDDIETEKFTDENLEVVVGTASFTDEGPTAKTIHATGDGKAAFEFKPNAYLSGGATGFVFWIFNAGETEVSVTFGLAGAFTVYPGVWHRVNYLVDWQKDWGVIDQDNRLVKFNMTIDGTGALDVYVGLWTVHTNEAVAFEVPDGIVTDAKLNEIYTIPEITAKDGSEVTWKILGPDGVQIGENNAPDFTPTQGGTYKIEYSATNGYGTSVYTVNVAVIAQTPELTSIDGHVHVDTGAAGAANYTVTPPTANDGSLVTWKVYQCNNSLLYGDGSYTLLDGNSPVNFNVIAAVSYKIEFSATNADGTTTIVQYVTGEGGMRLEEKNPDVFITENLDAEAGTAASVVDEGGLTDKTIKATGTDKINFTFKPNVYLSGGLSAMPFWVMNDSDSVISLTIAGVNSWSTPYTLQPGVWYRVDLPVDSHLKIWGIVDADNYLRHLNLTFTGTGELTVYVDLFTVHSSEAVAFVTPTEMETALQVNEAFIVPEATTQDNSAVTWTITNAEGMPVDAGWISENTFTPQSAGTYTLTYKATNVYGTSEKSFVLTVNDGAV